MMIGKGVTDGSKDEAGGTASLGEPPVKRECLLGTRTPQE
jgi:hypothetical protein